MRTKLSLLQLVLLVLSLDIATRDVTAGKESSSEDGLVLLRKRSGNDMNNTEDYLPRTRKVRSDNDVWTAGGTLCRPDNKCSYSQNSFYKYCFVDYNDNWDYCCTGECDFHGKDYMYCESGNRWQYCGDAGYTTVDGIACYYSHKCGVHQEVGEEPYYWCYIDHKLSWRKCCAPWKPCNYYSETYKWCYAGYKKDSDYADCK